VKHLFFLKDNSLPSCHKQIQKTTKFGFIVNGKEHIDLGCNLLSTPIGYNRHDIINHVLDRMKTIPICPAEYEFDTNEIQRLSDNIYNEKNKYSIFGLNGSDAIEAAIKTCKMYRTLNKQIKKQAFVSFDQTYHGSTELCLKLAGTNGVFTKTKTTIFSDKNHILFKNVNSYEQISDFEINTLRQLKLLFETKGHLINALVQESVSWGSDFQTLSNDYWNQLKALCNDYDVFLIIDDIAMCGGKTGKLYGFNVEPDIFCVGKSFSGGYFPLSICCINEKLYNGIKNSSLMHGFTFSMHLPGIVSANYYQTLLHTENILEKNYSLIAKGQRIANNLPIKKFTNTGSVFCIKLKNSIPTSTLDNIFSKHNLNLGITWNPYEQDKIFWCIPFLADEEYFYKVEINLKSALSDINK
jgi:adenosylmethionine-8-amino-7-oxononanoate aminotransferase